MKIILYWTPKNTKELENKVNISLEDLGLSSFIEVELSQDEKLKKELSIEKEPALIVVEESIDFKDTIFEGIIPEDAEIKSMFISIIWWSEGWWCGSSDSSGWCPSGCSC